ncbi:MAG: hypothetical protein U5K69_17875 [Balneolaceae bacterium]|nr:hypothetical protein [Balneolaceae bacterium]
MTVTIQRLQEDMAPQLEPVEDLDSIKLKLIDWYTNSKIEKIIIPLNISRYELWKLWN